MHSQEAASTQAWSSAVLLDKVLLPLKSTRQQNCSLVSTPTSLPRTAGQEGSHRALEQLTHTECT
jgi:hypothetical protein